MSCVALISVMLIVLCLSLHSFPNWKNESDENLIRIIQDQHNPDLARKAFDELCTRYWNRLYNFSLKLSGNHELANDVLVDALARAWVSLHTLKSVSCFSAWMHTTIRRAFLTSIDKEKKYYDRNRPLDDLILAMEANPNVDPANSVINADLYHSILDHVKCPITQTIILLHCDGKEWDDIGHTLGMNAEAVKKRFYRELRRLRGLRDQLLGE